MERVDKRLCNSGRWSRKQVRGLLKAGRVSADGTRVKDPSEKISEDVRLCVDGESLSTEGLVYLMINKPAGVISSTEDPREKTVLQILPTSYQKMGLFPVGRLDKDTEGLLLLTNDGPLAHHLLSPKYHIKKVYYVAVERKLEEADAAAFLEGIALKDGTLCQPAKLERLSENTALLSITEGKYHQVKRMMAARGKPVCYLKRLAMGPLQLDASLGLGEFRELTEAEREMMKQRQD